MNHLLRELAPITDAGWEELEEEARAAPRRPPRRPQARRLLGPARLGALGDEPRPHRAAVAGARRGRRRAAGAGSCRSSRPRAWFSLARAELELVDSGAVDIDLDPLDEAARRIALAENTAVFNGWPQAGITGIAAASPHDADRAQRRHERVPRPGRGRGRDPHVGRHRGPVRPRARAGRLHARGRDHRARRLPALRPPAEDHRRPDRLGARRERRARREPARRRLPARLRPGPRDRLPRATTPTRSTSTSSSRSASASRRPRPPSRCRRAEERRQRLSARGSCARSARSCGSCSASARGG